MTSGDLIKRQLGERIAKAREARGLSQTDLAERMEVTRGAVGGWETGESAPKTANLSGLAVELQVAFEWLATGRGDKSPPDPTRPVDPRTRLRPVPLLSWVSAGKLTDSNTQLPVDDVELLTVANLGRGEFFALRVQGDSMDRVSPEGSIIVVNRSDRTLVADKAYVFARRGETTYKLWQPEPAHLAPFSTNPANKPIFVKGKRDFEVIGRVRRTQLDL